jgi:hypothetical protein
VLLRGELDGSWSSYFREEERRKVWRRRQRDANTTTAEKGEQGLSHEQIEEGSQRTALSGASSEGAEFGQTSHHLNACFSISQNQLNPSEELWASTKLGHDS